MTRSPTIALCAAAPSNEIIPELGSADIAYVVKRSPFIEIVDINLLVLKNPRLLE